MAAPESEDQASLRFQVELEMVQCLANPYYLNFLAQRGYFKERVFINYLKYLLYWKEPTYAKFLKYPQALHMLELLQYEHLRKELATAQCSKFLDEQQLLHWQHYTRRRVRLQHALAAEQSQQQSQQQQQQQNQQQQQQQQQQNQQQNQPQQNQQQQNQQQQQQQQHGAGK
ncbi:mediator of RNA polymerase II transcription subunit 31 isoform X1 [Lampetra fluviatilis]